MTMMPCIALETAEIEALERRLEVFTEAVLSPASLGQIRLTAAEMASSEEARVRSSKNSWRRRRRMKRRQRGGTLVGISRKRSQSSDGDSVPISFPQKPAR